MTFVTLFVLAYSPCGIVKRPQKLRDSEIEKRMPARCARMARGVVDSPSITRYNAALLQLVRVCNANSAKSERAFQHKELSSCIRRLARTTATRKPYCVKHNCNQPDFAIYIFSSSSLSSLAREKIHPIQLARRNLFLSSINIRIVCAQLTILLKLTSLRCTENSLFFKAEGKIYIQHLSKIVT